LRSRPWSTGRSGSQGTDCTIGRSGGCTAAAGMLQPKGRAAATWHLQQHQSCRQGGCHHFDGWCCHKHRRADGWCQSDAATVGPPSTLLEKSVFALRKMLSSKDLSRWFELRSSISLNKKGDRTPGAKGFGLINLPDQSVMATPLVNTTLLRFLSSINW
jgi:hypothetical protein